MATSTDSSTDSAPRDLSATDRPYPVISFPQDWLAQFGGLSVAATRATPGKDRSISAEPGQGPNDPQA